MERDRERERELQLLKENNGRQMLPVYRCSPFTRSGLVERHMLVRPAFKVRSYAKYTNMLTTVTWPLTRHVCFHPDDDRVTNQPIMIIPRLLGYPHMLSINILDYDFNVTAHHLADAFIQSVGRE